VPAKIFNARGIKRTLHFAMTNLGLSPLCDLRAPGVTRKLKFTPDEDRLLLQLVNEHGTKSWQHIAALMPKRNTRQCRERYNNYLSPVLRHQKWTRQGDALLVRMVAEYHSKWNMMAKSFNNRSDIEIRNRSRYLARHPFTLAARLIESISSPPPRPPPVLPASAIPLIATAGQDPAPVPAGRDPDSTIARIIDFSNEPDEIPWDLVSDDSSEIPWPHGSIV
jgi:hypothetical protein